MYDVCDADLRTISEWQHLFYAKDAAYKLSLRGGIYFVCDRQGNVIAGYGSTPQPACLSECEAVYLHTE